MLNRLITLELGNDKGLRSRKNIIKLLYTYVLPNFSMIILAITIVDQKYYNPEKTLLFMLGLNLLITILFQYFTQRVFFRSLHKEVLLKFIPSKLLAFIKARLLLLVTKFYLPILIFNITFVCYFIQYNYFILCIVFLLLILFIIIIQIYIAITMRYIINLLRPVYLKVLQVISFLTFIVYTWMFFLFSSELIFETLEDTIYSRKYDPFRINLSFIFATITVIGFLISILKVRNSKLNSNLLIRNRNLSLDLNMTKLEWLYGKLYGIGLSKLQTLLFKKDIKSIFRGSKVLIILIGIMHGISLGMLFFFFIGISETQELGSYISKFYLAVIICQIILTGILSDGFKDIICLEKDILIMKNYNINLPKTKLISAKVKILRAFFFPKLTLMYSVLITTVLIIGELRLVLIYLLNYFICYLCRNTLEIWSVKKVNKMNSNKSILKMINIILILLFSNLLLQLFNSSDKSLVYYQLLSLGTISILYYYHLFIFKNNKSAR